MKTITLVRKKAQQTGATCDDREIQRRIDLRIIPPQPDYIREGDAWRNWLNKHVLCASSSCRGYRIRMRHGKYCERCNETRKPKKLRVTLG